MQLSLPPVPVFPTPAAPSTSAANTNNSGLVDPAAKGSQESSNQCFESFFPKKELTDENEPGSEEQGTDPEKEAAILAASFWMPVMQPVPAPQPAIPEELVVNSEASEVIAPAVSDTTENELTETKGEVPSEPAKATRNNFFSPAFNSRIGGHAKFQAPASPVAAPATAVVDGEAVVSDSVKTPVANVAIPDATPKAVTQETIARVALPAGTVTPMPFKRVSPILTATTKIEATPEGVAAIQETSPEDVLSADGSTPLPVATPEGTPLPVDAKFAPQAQSPKQPLSAQEKFAVRQSLLTGDLKTKLSDQEKHFLDIADKALKTASASVGISVAKPVASTMPSTTSARIKSASTSESTAAFVFSAETASVATSVTIDAPTPVSHVREAVAAVINAVDALERAADVQKKSVDLQFNVGHEKLDLRVEIRDGIVHTIFRTESPEMNRSLAREWNSVVTPAVAREVRLAEPVFSSSSSNDQSSFGAAGQGSSQQRNEYKAPTLFTSSVKRDFYESSTAEAKSSVSPAANSSQILNALA